MSESNTVSSLHTVLINTRTKMTVTGVTDVKSFDETLIIGKTEEEALSIRGENLHIDKLCLETGVLEVSGRIDSLAYSKAYIKNEGLWEKLFK